MRCVARARKQSIAPADPQALAKGKPSQTADWRCTRTDFARSRGEQRLQHKSSLHPLRSILPHHQPFVRAPATDDVLNDACRDLNQTNESVIQSIVALLPLSCCSSERTAKPPTVRSSSLQRLLLPFAPPVVQRNTCLLNAVTTAPVVSTPHITFPSVR